MSRTVTVTLPHHQYPIFIAANALERLGEVAAEITSRKRVTVLGDEKILSRYLPALEKGCAASGLKVLAVPFNGTEENKSAATVEQLYDELFALQLDRGDVIVAFGGGVVGDLVGFVAATFLRGVRFIQIPTTLLAMVDASVGGKVGYNTRHGKNLIGAFHQPEAVIIDPSVLHSLPEREFFSGLAECIKHAFIDGPALAATTSHLLADACNRDESALCNLIEKNVLVKARIVEADEREQGIRAHLNFGHTFGHAIENAAGYGTFLHGEAVALGMCAATATAAFAGYCGGQVLETLETLLKAANLPVRATLPSTETLIAAMQTDKKVLEGKVRLVLPQNVGTLCITDEIPSALIARGWDYIRQEV